MERVSGMKAIVLEIMLLLLNFVDASVNARCENCSDWCLAAFGRNARFADSAPYTTYLKVDENLHNKPGLDQALMMVISKANYNITIMVRSSECYNCSYQELVNVAPYSSIPVLVDTKHALDFQVLLQTLPLPSIVCTDKNHFTQYGNYTYHISPNDTTPKHPVGYICVLNAGDPPMNVNVPVWVMVAIIAVLFLTWNVVLVADKRYALYDRMCLRTHRIVNNDLGMPQSRSVSTTNLNTDSENMDGSSAIVNTPTHKTRLKSLDTFRGLSIIVMIFVNYGGGEYWYFQHSGWNGLTVADLVFPWFIFIMGTSMFFSFDSQIRRSVAWYTILARILKRSVILILMGLALNSIPKCPRETSLENLRIPGVLQRIGVTYLYTSLVHLVFVYRQEVSWLYHVLEWLVHLLGMTLYLTLTFLLPVPGCPTGYLGPGGRADDGAHENCTGGAAGYIDRKIFGNSHIYQHPTCWRVYQCPVPYDPEGLLGCLTSIFLCFLGLQAGKFFKTSCWKSVFSKFLAACAVTISLGVLLCLGSKETGWIPINKNLWSPSYILCMAGSAYYLLAVCYLLVDRLKVWDGSPFVYAGMNPIILYVCHEIFQFYLPISFRVPMDHWSQLVMDVWGTVFWMIVAFILHKKSCYFSI